MKRSFTLRVGVAMLLMALGMSVPGSTVYALTNGLCLTPPMGWSSWNMFGCGITETDVMRMADAMATNGMKDAGYQYINIDDCWAGYRDTNGVMVADTNSFPSGIKALADYVHSRGLKLGIYSDRGTNTCAGRPGSYGYENLDALTYASWGVDYLKYDSCYVIQPDSPDSDYTQMSEALASCGRPIAYSLGTGYFAPFMPIVGNLWRTTLDIHDSFASMVANLDGNNNSASAAGPGHWNDPDMLEIGNGGMSDTEYQAHFSLWCIVAAPLIAGNNLANMSQATRDMLTDPEAIAVDQDPTGVQGIPVRSVPGVGGNLEVWCKPLGTDSTTKAVALFNRSSTNASITAYWCDISLQLGNATVRDLWTKTDLGTFVNSYSAVVPAHGVELLKIVGTGIVDPPPPSASFTAAPTNGVVPLIVTFVDTSACSITNWFWSFGDGTTSNATANSIRHTYFTPGAYNVTEIVSGPGGSDSSTRANCITVLPPPPSASFSADLIGGVTPLTVTFTDTSTGSITNWFWSFGDGNTTNATTTSVSHTYVAAGTYSVTEIVTGPGGSGSTTRANCITVLTLSQGQQFRTWQILYFGCTSCQQAQMSADADGTGQNNLFKFVAGLDPTNPASVFKLQIASVPNQPQAMNLTFFPSVSGRNYVPQFGTDLLSGVWLTLSGYTGLATNGSRVTITDTNLVWPQKFYRIDISLP